MFYKVLVFLFISSNLWGYPYYLFDKSKIKVDSLMMDRYVRPQLRSLVDEYYQSLSSLNPINNNLIILKNIANDANLQWRSWYDQCSRLKDGCLKDLNKVKKYQKNFEVQICKLQNQLFDRAIFVDQYTTDAIFLLAGELDELTRQNALVIQTIDTLQIIAMDSDHEPFQTKIDSLESLITTMQTTTDRIFTTLLSKSLKRQFFDIWFFFIKDLEFYLASNKSNDFLVDRLEILNQGWNTFHMLISKGIVYAPHNVASTLSIMHNRWNSVLKIILKD